MSRPERFQFRVVLKRIVEQVAVDGLLLCLKEGPCHAAALTGELRIRGQLSKRRSRRRIRICRIDSENTVARGSPKKLVDGGGVAALVDYRAGAVGPRPRLARSVADDHGHRRVLPV